MDFILEERVEKACDLFRQGYNCSQSVFLAYNDLLGVESTLAATISGPLGGGMGRLREVCGAVSGMSLIAGFLAPCPDPAVRQVKHRRRAGEVDPLAQIKPTVVVEAVREGREGLPGHHGCFCLGHADLIQVPVDAAHLP